MKQLHGHLGRLSCRAARTSSTGSGSIPSTATPFDQQLAARAAMEAELVERGLRNEEFAEEWEQENAEGLRGGWDASRRDQELDADGVVGEVIFPDADAVTGGASAPFGAGLAATADVPMDLLMAGARAHNRWLAELCNQSPHRRAGVAIVPIFDVDAAVAEITRARESGLRGGILIPSMWQPYEPYHDARYDPMWAACSDLEMPVHVHSGAADRASYGEQRRHLRGRGPLVVDPAAVVPPLGGDIRAVPRR